MMSQSMPIEWHSTRSYVYIEMKDRISHYYLVNTRRITYICVYTDESAAKTVQTKKTESGSDRRTHATAFTFIWFVDFCADAATRHRWASSSCRCVYTRTYYLIHACLYTMAEHVGRLYLLSSCFCSYILYTYVRYKL